MIKEAYVIVDKDGTWLSIFPKDDFESEDELLASLAPGETLYLATVTLGERVL